ncbi:MAG: xanthine phosphoribosyltransferase [Bacteroidales bacterium]|nr:xanthine phosphoribosyltransferase [Bacteroidales bacterium]
MKELNDRIMKDGRSLGNGIIKMDRFLNHQIDPKLMMMAAQELVNRFAENKRINKILTVEASGIAPAILIGYLMKLPVVFCKKAHPSTMSDFYSAKVHSFTKQNETHIIVAKDYLTPKDHVLFIDDVLAFGCSGTGIVDLCNQAGATIEGMGFLVEKSFEGGRHALEQKGVTRIESLAIIESLDNNKIKIKATS